MHTPDPKLDALLVALLEQARGLSELVNELSDHEESRSLVDAIDANNQTVDLIADFLGVPADNTTAMPYEEACRGKCRHGVEVYCRDWLLDWACGPVGGADEDSPGAAEFLNQMRLEGTERRAADYVCPRCEHDQPAG